MDNLPIVFLVTALAAIGFAIFSRGKRRIAAGMIAVACGALATIPQAGAADTTKLGMTGHWKGEGKIIVDWCKQKKLPIALDIAADGTVTGTIGDAVLVDGKLGRNRGAIGRLLKLKTDFIIIGKLKGEIVKAEGIKRPSVSFPLNFDGSKFSGGLHTSGKKVGGKPQMKLSVSDVELKSSGK